MSNAQIQMLSIREWSDKVYGNTYSSVKAWVFAPGGKQYIVTRPFYYGRGVDLAVREVAQALRSYGVIDTQDVATLTPFRDDTCIVARRRDLHRNGRNNALPHGASLISIN